LACALPNPSSAATATVTALFRKSLRCIEVISLVVTTDKHLSNGYYLYRFISFVQWKMANI
jgi:hypothetical protein